MALLDVVRLLAAIALAFVAGKLVAKLNLPSILGWLITGMVLGPHAWNLLSDSVLGSAWFDVTESLLECTVGLMIGAELLWHQMKKAGAQIVVTTITESLGTFLVVSLVFSAIFWATGTPIYLAFIFGGIALATAPAPSLSIVSQMQTSGPVTRTLIPMAALDDLVGAFVFFMVIAFVSAHVSTAGVPVGMVIFLVFLPVFIGIATGFLAGKLMQKTKTARDTLAGLYTAVYIVSRAIGKYSGAYFGAAITHAPKTVRNFLGFTLLPHSGVSLVFTGIAVSVLSDAAPECASIIQGTIAAAAVINEIIAVYMAKKGFEWAGELPEDGRRKKKGGVPA